MGKNVQLKILIWHMVGEKWLKVGQGKVESKLCQNKKKNVKRAEMVGFIKTCDQYPHKFNFGHFFRSLVVFPFFAGGKQSFKKQCLGEMGDSLLFRG